MSWLVLVDRVPGPQHLARRSAYIQSAYVVLHESSTGVGTRLMELVLDHTRGLGVDYVAVHPSEAAFSFYRRLRFE
jgi:GNAT superfamily N-acetyltransferase